MSTPEIRTTQVDLKGLMRVLGHNLYSTPSVALRELVQNAHDSVTRRRTLDPGDWTGHIRVEPRPETHALIIEDTGAGLTHDEIVRDLATVGAGGTGRMRKEGVDGLIGQFGLGFLSAFFVSERVELYTTSCREPDRGWRFMSAGGQQYSVAAAPARPVGTRVVLHLSERFYPMTEPETCEALLQRYCSLLQVPVYLGALDSTPVNHPPPPWRDPSLADEPEPHRVRQALAFASRFEHRFEPICTLPLAPRDGGDARGMLWIQDGSSYGNHDNRNLSVFVRGMLVDGEARELLPIWAGFCGGVIESEVLTPTASREDLQRDAAYTATAAQIRESLIDGLGQLSRTRPAAWRRVLSRHNEALLGAALADERLFDLLAEQLKVPTSEGDLSVPVIQHRSEGRIHVSLGEGSGNEEVLFRAMQVPVVTGTRYGALPFCERHATRAGAAVVRLGTRAGDAQLFAPAELDADAVARLQALLARPGVQVVPTRFAPAALPVVLVPDREAALKRRLEQDEADKRIASALLGLARIYTARIDDSAQARLYVNLDAPVIQGLLTAAPATAEAVAGIVKAIADLMGDRRDGRAQVDTAGAFRTLSAALVQLLGAEGGA